MQTQSAFPSVAAFTPRRQTGFTLIELLVVIAIIAVLAAILFPVFAQAREKAHETTCASNLRQIGLAVRMYVQDYDEAFPIFHAYNYNPTPWQVGHLGIEIELQPYIKNREIFRCPDDSGGPYQKTVEVPSASTYHEAYGSSYRFSASCFTIVHGATGSHQNNFPIDTASYPARLVTDATYQFPAETRIMRDEMLPWFSPERDPGGTKYFYAGDTNYYQQWHPRGGGFVFADGHAKFETSELAFQKQRANPEGRTYLDGCWYGCE
jgi:prepilin-type N-terminal cleavage/methylation domain-containing protein/prepilin-type processing-associated H-X9-DG protein